VVVDDAPQGRAAQGRDYLVGSTAERVVRYAQAPVYVFK